jgi:hypothetical protein
MDILRTLGQIPFMFIGALLIVVAVTVVWLFTRGRSRGIRDL